MEFTVQFSEYLFAGVVQRTIVLVGAPISGTASEQRTGEWAWFLRYTDGEYAGEGIATSWGAALRGIRDALVGEVRYGRLGYLNNDVTRYDDSGTGSGREQTRPSRRGEEPR